MPQRQRRQRRRRLSAASLNASFNQDIATPAKRNESSVEASEAEVSFIDLGENDDNLERSQIRQRRSMVNMITPIRSVHRSSSHRSRRSVHSSSPFSKYTNDELSAIYKECIIKAQQGKINQQNAWNLHLVDNIKEITDSDTNTLNTNNKQAKYNKFARASHTIDVASKIYGYRVDSVHNKTYKVLGSIHQQNGERDGLFQSNHDRNNNDLNAERKRKREIRNRNVGKSTLCELDKLYKLNESMTSLCVEVDPLFHKTASCFDEGGAKGLLMNTLYVQNGCDIVFDSNTKIEQNKDITNNGIQIDNDLIQNIQEIEKENQWMTQLFSNTFKKEIDNDDNVKFDGFTQPIDVTSPDFDVSTQTKPQNFIVDMKWIQNTSICPLLNIFENNINAIKRDNININNNNNNISPQHISPEKDLNNNNNGEDIGLFDADNIGFDDDDDVLMNMPDFTIGGDDNLNAQDLFHEELLTQAVAPQNQQQPTRMNITDLQLDITNNGNNIQYVVGQSGQSIIGNMGVEPMGFRSFNDNQQQEILNNLQLEQLNENGQYDTLHRGGIYKRGAMNINAMNRVIAKLENADFESLTSFFDSKKHGNWAGPDQWYHRRYQLTLQQQTKTAATAITSPSKQPIITKQRGGRKEKKQWKRFDFLSIARGNLIDEKEFEEPQRSYNTLTQGVLDKNKKTYHILPSDLQIKPDIFIKLFHRPNYSVWKHWLRQHQLRMVKNNKEEEHEQQQEQEQEQQEQPQFIQQHAAAMAVIGDQFDDDQEDQFQYNYDNPLDSSHFVPNINDNNDYDDNGDDNHDGMGYFDFNLNGYDLVDIDSNQKLEKLKVEFATSAKKVNVRKLKLKLWDKIVNDLSDKNEINKENIQNNSNEDIDIDVDIDIDDNNNNNNNNNNNDDKIVSFQDTLDSLPNNISTSISVQMCFICLLHLANEKELQFVPKTNNERDNFFIQYANSQSEFEIDAQKINPIMVLGMQ